MADFTDFEPLYAHLEEIAGEYKYSQQIGKLFQKLRNEKHEQKLEEDSLKAQWEVDCFNFRIEGGDLKPSWSVATKDGQVREYPSFSNLDEKAYDYIQKRLETTKNPLLRARYAHVLWCSPKKHANYAQAAIDAYLELIKIYEEKDKAEPDSHYGHDVVDSVESASFLAGQVKYKLDVLKREIKRLIREFNPASNSSFMLTAELIRHMIEEKGKFSKEDFDGIIEVCWIRGQGLAKEGRFHQAITMFELGRRIDDKLSVKSYEWIGAMAECYEGLMDQRGDQDLASISFCQDALDLYKKIKDAKKVEELEQRYEKIRGSQSYGEIRTKIDLGKILKSTRETAEKLCEEKSPEEIIGVLMADKGLLPRLKDLKKTVAEIAKKSLLQYTFPKTVADQFGHVCEHFTTEEEREYFAILEQYSMEIEIGVSFLVNDIFVTAIRKGKLSLAILMDYFRDNSWYGKNIRKRISAHKERKYNWLNLLLPGLHNYFGQISASIANPANEPNFVLSIDSLTLKIEGLIRDICAFSGVTTFVQTKDKQGRNVTREKDVNVLLREDAIKDLFDEDDLLLFKYVLVEKAGLNLRHKIAHCLAGYHDYNMTTAHLLLLVLIRLGKYDFLRKDEVAEDAVAKAEDEDMLPEETKPKC